MTMSFILTVEKVDLSQLNFSIDEVFIGLERENRWDES